MENDFGKHTREKVSDLPFDYKDPTYRKYIEYKEKMTQLIGLAICVYSFEKNCYLLMDGKNY